MEAADEDNGKAVAFELTAPLDCVKRRSSRLGPAPYDTEAAAAESTRGG